MRHVGDVDAQKCKSGAGRWDCAVTGDECTAQHSSTINTTVAFHYATRSGQRESMHAGPSVCSFQDAADVQG